MMKIYPIFCALIGLLVASLSASAAAPLKAESPLALSGKVGRFDFMEVDTARHRLLAAHKGAGTLEVVDLKSGKALSAVPVGQVQGLAVDRKSDTYVLGDEEEHKVVFVSAKTLKQVGEVSVSGPVDAVAVDSKNGMAYADEDDGSHVWVIDVKGRKLVATIEIPGVPEFVAYDPKTDRIYQNIKNKDSVVVINPQTNKVEAEWPTAPATGPHGAAVDSKAGHLFVAGHNGKLVMIDLNTGHIVSQADIASGTDQIAFDETSKTIYCASKGFISVVKVENAGLEALDNVPDHAGAHTLAVDAKSHSVWISYADDKHSYLQRYTK